MKHSRKLFMWALGCWVGCIVFSVPQLSTFAMIFLTGAMVIKGVKEIIIENNQ